MDQNIKDLLNELSGALADMVTAMNKKTESSDEISSALADIAQALEAKSEGKSLDSIIGAIKSLRPVITLQPAPVTVHVVQAECVFQVSMTYDVHDRITDCQIKKVAA